MSVAVLLTLVTVHPDAASAAPRYDIDNTLTAGGAGTDTGRSIAFDTGGNEYIAGTFTGPATFGTSPGTTLAGYLPGGKTIFLAKYSPTSALLWVQQLGGTIASEVGTVAIDPYGGVYVTGSYAGTGTFGSGPATKTLSSVGNTMDGFLARFDTGGVLAWAKSFGGPGYDTAAAISVRGAPVVTGTFNGTATFGEDTSLKTITAAFPDQMYVAYYGMLGKLQWVVTATSPTPITPRAIANDSAGRTYVTGTYRTSLTVPGSAPLSITAVGGTDAFIMALNPFGGGKWLSSAGGASADESLGIAVDPTGTVATITGFFTTSAQFGTTGATTVTSVAAKTAYVARYAAATGILSWVKGAQGSGLTIGSAIALDSAGNAVVGGVAIGTTAFAGPVPVNTTSPVYTGFVVMFDPTGAATWGRLQTASTMAWTTSVAFTTVGSVGATGFYNGTMSLTGDFNSSTVTTSAGNDVFGVRFKAHANRPPTTTPVPVNAVTAIPVAVTLTGADPDNDPLSFAITTGPAHGAITGTGANLSYASGAGYAGPDSFTYTVSDGFGGSTTGTVAITVVAPVTPPVANNATLATIAGRAAAVTVTGSDPGGSALTFALDTPNAAHGTVTGTGPTFTYTASAGYIGPDSFGFKVTNNLAQTATALVTINVKRPNVVVILTDDQTLGQQTYLTKTNALFAAEGTKFSNYVVSYSECCPSRATLLTGQYSHNNLMLASMLPTGGVSKFDDTNSLATWLQGAGYYTSLGGKYFNGYGVDLPPTFVPKGWSDWFGFYDPNTYEQFNYDVSVNGTPTHFGSNAADYSTDVLGAHAQQVIQSKAGSATPFFVYVAPSAPHNVNQGVATVAPPRYANTLTGVQAPRSPSFNQADVSTMPPPIKNLPLLSDQTIAGIDNIYRVGAEAILAIDDMVEGIYKKLKATGELDNTVFMYTSDNGFEYGDHRIPLGKSDQYEATVKLPLLVRGPGFPSGGTVTQPTANIDLAPTIAAAAGVTPQRTVDGVTLTNFVNDASYGIQRTILIENGALLGRTTYQGVRNHRFSYIMSSVRDMELYDLSVDPYQISNIGALPNSALAVYGSAVRLDQAATCAGQTCHIGIP